MSEASHFRDLIGRVRAGDEEAAAELFRRYEPAIRRTVRARLRDNRLRRLLDSMDICQSVLASFFVRVALGRYELETPEHLLQLLTSMAHHKLTNKAREQETIKRDKGRNESSPVEQWEITAPDPSPSQHVAARELMEEARRRLSAEERRLLELREQGQDWATIAAQVGGSPEALRRQLARAIDRVAEQLGLDESPQD